MSEFKDIYERKLKFGFICERCGHLHNLTLTREINFINSFDFKYNEDNINNKESIIYNNDKYWKNLSNDINFPFGPELVNLNCVKCEKETKHFMIDKEIAQSVSLLRRMGFSTIFSCSGHNNVNEKPYIKIYDYKSKYISELYNLFMNFFDEYYKISDAKHSCKWDFLITQDKNCMFMDIELDMNSISVEDYTMNKHIEELETLLSDFYINEYIQKFRKNKEE